MKMLRIIYAIWLLTVVETIKEVLGQVEIIHPTEHFLNVNLGTTVDIKCESKQHIHWIHNGQAVDTNDKYTITVQMHPDKPDKQISVLALKDVESGDSGRITCMDSTDTNTADFITIFVTNHNYIPTVEIIEPNTDHIRVSPGRHFQISCLNHQPNRISWYHNGKRLNFNGLKTIITGAIRLDRTWSGLITVKYVEAKDAGIYSCREDVDSQNSDEVLVTIDEPPDGIARVDIVEPSLSHITLKEGTPLHLKCTAPKSTHIGWLKDGMAVDSSEENGYVITQAIDGDFITSLLSRESPVVKEATYTCINIMDWTDHDKVTVNYGGTDNHDYKVATQTRQVIITMQSNFRLECRLGTADNIVYEVEWMRSGEQILGGEKYIISRSIKPSILTIRNTDKNDVGEYQCKFINSESRLTEGIVIFNVTGTPCPTLQVPHNGLPVECPSNAYVGDTCSILCEVKPSGLVGSIVVICVRNKETGAAYWSNTEAKCTAPYSPEAEENIPSSLSHVLLRAGEPLRLDCGQSGVWTQGSTLLHTGSKYHIINGTLVIKNTGKADAAVYTCTLHEKGHIFGMKKFNVTYMACRPLRIPSSGFVTGCSRNAIYGETCTFQCYDGFEMYGSPITSCELYPYQTDTYWTSAVPTCTNNGLQDEFFKNTASSQVFIPAYMLFIMTTIYGLLIL